MIPRLLVVDDDRFTRHLFENLYQDGRIEVDCTGSLAEASAHLARRDYNLIVMDNRLPDGSGLDRLQELLRHRPRQLAILMTAFADVRDAVSSVRQGIFDYVTKPFASLEELEAVVDKALELDAAYREIDGLKLQLAASGAAPQLIGRAPAMLALLDQVRRVAPLDTRVLIEGESGTGKELIARLLHDLGTGERARLVAVNCGAIPEALLESSLFGYERGAFTGALRTTRGYFEEADQGTLFLDEIADMSPRLQNSLLRVVQEGRFVRLGSAVERSAGFRLVCATNRPLDEEVRAGRFRADLYYRLNVVLLRVPPLRERHEDIVPLALHFFELFRAKFGRKVEPPTARALRWLENQPWPGNVRQLQHALERAVALCVHGAIDLDDLQQDPARTAELELTDLPLEAARQRFEEDYLRRAMARANGNVAEAARQIGIARQNLHLKLKRLGLVN